jgi:hypothetical protein
MDLLEIGRLYLMFLSRFLRAGNGKELTAPSNRAMPFFLTRGTEGVKK